MQKEIQKSVESVSKTAYKFKPIRRNEMALITRYNVNSNMYEIGYYRGHAFVVVHTQKVL